LIDGVFIRDHDREGGRLLSSRAPRLLPRARDGVWESNQDRSVERADVDPQFQRVRRDHPAEVALEKTPLMARRLLGEISTAIRAQQIRQAARLARQPLARVTIDELRDHARLRENDRLHAALQQRDQDPLRVDGRAAGASESPPSASAFS